MKDIANDLAEEKQRLTREAILEGIRQGEDDLKSGNVLSHARVIQAIQKEVEIGFGTVKK